MGRYLTSVDSHCNIIEQVMSSRLRQRDPPVGERVLADPSSLAALYGTGSLEGEMCVLDAGKGRFDFVTQESIYLLPARLGPSRASSESSAQEDTQAVTGAVRTCSSPKQRILRAVASCTCQQALLIADGFPGVLMSEFQDDDSQHDDDSQESGSSRSPIGGARARRAFRIRHSTMKKLRSKTSSLLDVQNSPTWLQLDAIHEEYVRKVLVGSHYWVLSDTSSQVFGICILLQSVAFGVELGFEAERAEEGLLEHPGPGLFVIAIFELIFLIIFSIEYCLRSQALGSQYVFTLAGLFDAFVLVATLAHAAFYVLEVSSVTASSPSLQTIRTFRLLRIIQVLQAFPALAMLVKGLFSTFIAIQNVMILLTALCYAGALLCCELLGTGHGGLFASVFQGFLTHIQLVLIEAWPDIAGEMMLDSYLWGVYVVAFLLISNFAVLNVVTGVICERVLLLAANQPPDSMEEADFKLMQLRERISQLYLDAMGKAPDMSQKELLQLLRTPPAMDTLKAMKIALPQKAEDLCNILDRDGAKSISNYELQEGLMRLRGSSYDRVSLESHCSVHKSFWSHGQVLDNAFARQKAAMRDAREAIARRITEALEVPVHEEMARLRLRKDAVDGSRTVDLEAIRAAIGEFRQSLLALQDQCALHSQGCQETCTTDQRMSTGTQTGAAHEAESVPVSASQERITRHSLGGTQASSKSLLLLPLPPVPRLASPELPPQGKGTGASQVRKRGFAFKLAAPSIFAGPTMRHPLKVVEISDIAIQEWTGYFRANSFVNTGQVLAAML